MPTSAFLQQCRDLAGGFGAPEPDPGSSDADSLIGFFQMFRPDGTQLDELMSGLPAGEELYSRLQGVFEVAGDNRRPTAGRDAYFIVRKPQALDPTRAEHLAKQWLGGMNELASRVGELEIVTRISTLPAVRVLEGIPPKHPKVDREKSQLMKAVVEACPKLTEKIVNVDPHARLLSRAYYFIACDPMLRDYLMWPFFAESTGLADPFASYFELWSHGVKYRIFGETQVDLYLPRDAA